MRDLYFAGLRPRSTWDNFCFLLPCSPHMTKKFKPVLHTPYENLVIGNFLYGLGLSLGTQAGANAPVANISNTQQTPLDPILADVWLTFPGVVRLLEFKRREAKVTKDEQKRAALSARLSVEPPLIPISRRIHWFAEIFPHPGHGVDLSMCPYLDFTARTTQRQSLADYVQELTTAALHPSSVEPDPAEVSAYLRALGELSEASSASGAGLLVHIAPNGVLQFMRLADLRDLNLQREAQQARDEQLSIALELQRDGQFELALERKARTQEKGQTYER
jgi:hypothetical protein